ncbi:MFS transporter, partial [Sulfitobacter sp. AS92]|uniref:MFS transporter n=1 Tax=Sulfitobacter sp. AS92 TaxID=3135783 RepID=UPI00318094E0
MLPRHVPITMLLMFTALIVVGQLYLTIPLTNEIAALFAVEPTAATWAATAFGFAYAIGFLIWGPLSDRFGRRTILVGGLVAMTAVTALLGLSESFPMFMAGRAAQGFVAASFPPVALSIVNEALPPSRRPLGVSLISFSFLAAAPLAQFAAVGVPVSPTAFMLGIAPLYLVMAAGLFLVLPAKNAMPVTSPQGRPQDRHDGTLFGNPVAIAGWGAALTVLFGFVIFQAGTTMGIGTDFDPQIVRLIGLPPLALSLFAAPISKRFGAPVTARTGLILSATGLAISAIGGNMIALGAICVSGGVGLAVPGLIATLSSAASDSNRGLTLSLYTFSLFVGASLASPVAAALAPAGAALLYGLPALLLLITAGGLTFSFGRGTP